MASRPENLPLHVKRQRDDRVDVGAAHLADGRIGDDSAEQKSGQQPAHSSVR